MEGLQKKLKTISVGRVLDVGVGIGKFSWILAEYLKEYSEIVGIDISEKKLDTAKKNLTQKNISLRLMSADNLQFDDESFDIVAISETLHHLPGKDKIGEVLREMKRVLKPGGIFIIKEMFCDHQNQTQRILVDYHHWFAEIDRVLGKVHSRTFKRNEIIDIAEELNLSEIDISEFTYYKEIFTEKELVDSLCEKCNKKIERIEGYHEYEELKKRGEIIKKNIRDYGYSYENQLVLMGKKK